MKNLMFAIGLFVVVSVAAVAVIETTKPKQPNRTEGINAKEPNQPVVSSPKQQWQQPKQPAPQPQANQPQANKSNLGPKVPAINGLRKSITQHVCENGGSCFGGNLVDDSIPGAVPMQRSIQPGQTCPNCAGQMFVEIWSLPKN